MLPVLRLTFARLSELDRLPTTSRFKQSVNHANICTAICERNARFLSKQDCICHILHLANVQLLPFDLDSLRLIAARQIDLFIFIGLERVGNMQSPFASDDFHQAMKWNGEAAIELGVDLVIESHLPDERLIDPGPTCNLPAKHLQRILTDHRAGVTDGIAAHIPDASASHPGIKPHVPFSGEEKTKGT